MWLSEVLFSVVQLWSDPTVQEVPTTPAAAQPFAPVVSAPVVSAPVVPAVPAPSAASAPLDAKLSALVDAVQKAYDGTTDFSGAFTQKYTYTMLRRTQESSGTLRFKKPGLMRWDYTAPQPKAFVIDGTSLWMHQPEDHNAFVNACFQQSSDLVAPIAFMWGAGRIKDQFDVSWFDGVFGDKSDHHLLLVPKTPSAVFAKLILVVDPKTSRVKQSVVVDPAGNVNQFIFKNVVFNKALKDAVFVFVPPAGTHVARLPGSCEAPVAGLN